MLWRWLLAGALFAVLGGGCGGEEGTGIPAAFETFAGACDAVPGCREPRVDTSAPRETIWRVVVVRGADGSITIDGVDAVEVFEGFGVPVGPLSGSHVLVGLNAAGEPVDSQAIRLAEEVNLESLDDAWYADAIDLSGVETNTIGYVRALGEIVALAVVAEGGAIVARAPAMATFETTEPGAAASALIAVSPAHCGHIVVMDGEADRRYARGLPYNLTTTASGETVTIRLISPGPAQLAVIRAALNRMTPLLCHGITRIALGRMPTMPGLGGATQMGSNDLIFINIDVRDGTTGRRIYEEEALARSAVDRARMMRVIFHETAHATESMLNSEGSRATDFGGFWLPDGRSLARDTIANVRLDKGLGSEWQRVHGSFAALGWAGDHPCTPTSGCGDGVPGFRESTDWTATQTAEAGAMSRYGATSYWDDIADMVAWPTAAAIFSAAGVREGPRNKEDFACQELRSIGDQDVPSRVSAVYTKLKFLQDLGLLHPDDVDACIGDGVRLPIDTEGFDFWQDGSLRRSFRGAVAARINNYADGRNAFEMEGAGQASFSGTEYPATVRVLLQVDPGVPLEEAPWPRGVYALGTSGNAFELRLEGAPAGDFDVTEGFALVAEASNARIAGSVFITQAFRLSAPVPVPQVFDPPLIIRFLIEQ